MAILCWHDEANDLTICSWVLGVDGIRHSANSFDCFTGIFTVYDNDAFIGCRNCDTGCKLCQDDLDQGMSSWADESAGNSYVRPAAGAVNNRNALGERKDIQSVQVGVPERRAEMFLDEITLEHSACYDNNGDNVCWDTSGHPCNCHKYPAEVDPVGIRPSGVQWRDTVFFNRTGWPMRQLDMYCRRWTDTPKAHRFTVRSDNGQTQFVGMGPWADCATNALVMCAAKIPSSECLDCASSRDGSPGGGGEPVSTFYQIQQPEIGKFDRLLVRTNAAIMTNDDGVRNDVIAKVSTEQFPDPTDAQPLQTMNFDQLDHQVHVTNNNGLGEYERHWTAQSIDDGVKVTDLHARLRWGDCFVQAELVMVDVRFRANVFLHRTRHRPNGPSVAPQYITPYIVVNLEVTLGVRARLRGNPCTVGGEPVTLTNEPGRFSPTVTPTGNAVVYTDRRGNPIRVQSVVQWRGRLNQHSFPPSPVHWLDPPNTTNALKCSSIRTKLGIMTVPGMMGRFFNAEDELPVDPPGSLGGRLRAVTAEDANTVYGGHMELQFQDA